MDDIRVVQSGCHQCMNDIGYVSVYLPLSS